jgi:hypothetical protein
VTMEQTVWAPADRVVTKAGEQASVGQVLAAAKAGTRHAGAGRAATAGR